MAFALVLGLGALALAGVVAFVVFDAPSWRWAGVAAVLGAGVGTFRAARSARFATMLQGVMSPIETAMGQHHGEGLMGPGALDPEYRAQTGVHPGPAIVGVLLMILGAVLALALLVP